MGERLLFMPAVGGCDWIETFENSCDDLLRSAGYVWDVAEGKWVLPAETWTFEDGAVVELRSGSAPMTVHASLRGRDGCEYVQVCYWHGEEGCEVYDLKAVVELKRVVVG